MLKISVSSLQLSEVVTLLLSCISQILFMFEGINVFVCVAVAFLRRVLRFLIQSFHSVYGFIDTCENGATFSSSWGRHTCAIVYTFLYLVLPRRQVSVHHSNLSVLYIILHHSADTNWIVHRSYAPRGSDQHFISVEAELWTNLPYTYPTNERLGWKPIPLNSYNPQHDFASSCPKKTRAGVDCRKGSFASEMATPDSHVVASNKRTAFYGGTFFFPTEIGYYELTARYRQADTTRPYCGRHFDAFQQCDRQTEASHDQGWQWIGAYKENTKITVLDNAYASSVGKEALVGRHSGQWHYHKLLPSPSKEHIRQLESYFYDAIFLFVDDSPVAESPYSTNSTNISKQLFSDFATSVSPHDTDPEFSSNHPDITSSANIPTQYCETTGCPTKETYADKLCSWFSGGSIEDWFKHSTIHQNRISEVQLRQKQQLQKQQEAVDALAGGIAKRDSTIDGSITNAPNGLNEVNYKDQSRHNGHSQSYRGLSILRSTNFAPKVVDDATITAGAHASVVSRFSRTSRTVQKTPFPISLHELPTGSIEACGKGNVACSANASPVQDVDLTEIVADAIDTADPDDPYRVMEKKQQCAGSVRHHRRGSSITSADTDFPKPDSHVLKRIDADLPSEEIIPLAYTAALLLLSIAHTMCNDPFSSRNGVLGAVLELLCLTPSMHLRKTQVNIVSALLGWEKDIVATYLDSLATIPLDMLRMEGIQRRKTVEFDVSDRAHYILPPSLFSTISPIVPPRFNEEIPRNPTSESEIARSSWANLPRSNTRSDAVLCLLRYASGNHWISPRELPSVTKNKIVRNVLNAAQDSLKPTTGVYGSNTVKQGSLPSSLQNISQTREGTRGRAGDSDIWKEIHTDSLLNTVLDICGSTTHYVRSDLVSKNVILQILRTASSKKRVDKAAEASKTAELYEFLSEMGPEYMEKALKTPGVMPCRDKIAVKGIIYNKFNNILRSWFERGAAFDGEYSFERFSAFLKLKGRPNTLCKLDGNGAKLQGKLTISCTKKCCSHDTVTELSLPWLSKRVEILSKDVGQFPLGTILQRIKDLTQNIFVLKKVSTTSLAIRISSSVQELLREKKDRYLEDDAAIRDGEKTQFPYNIVQSLGMYHGTRQSVDEVFCFSSDPETGEKSLACYNLPSISESHDDFLAYQAAEKSSAKSHGGHDSADQVHADMLISARNDGILDNSGADDATTPGSGQDSDAWDNKESPRPACPVTHLSLTRLRNLNPSMDALSPEISPCSGNCTPKKPFFSKRAAVMPQAINRSGPGIAGDPIRKISNLKDDSFMSLVDTNQSEDTLVTDVTQLQDGNGAEDEPYKTEHDYGASSPPDSGTKQGNSNELLFDSPKLLRPMRFSFTESDLPQIVKISKEVLESTSSACLESVASWSRLDKLESPFSEAAKRRKDKRLSSLERLPPYHTLSGVGLSNSGLPECITHENNLDNDDVTFVSLLMIVKELASKVVIQPSNTQDSLQELENTEPEPSNLRSLLADFRIGGSISSRKKSVHVDDPECGHEPCSDTASTFSSCTACKMPCALATTSLSQIGTDPPSQCSDPQRDPLRYESSESADESPGPSISYDTFGSQMFTPSSNLELLDPRESDSEIAAVDFDHGVDHDGLESPSLATAFSGHALHIGSNPLVHSAHQSLMSDTPRSGASILGTLVTLNRSNASEPYDLPYSDSETESVPDELPSSALLPAEVLLSAINRIDGSAAVTEVVTVHDDTTKERSEESDSPKSLVESPSNAESAVEGKEVGRTTLVFDPSSDEASNTIPDRASFVKKPVLDTNVDSRVPPPSPMSLMASKSPLLIPALALMPLPENVTILDQKPSPISLPPLQIPSPFLLNQAGSYTPSPLALPPNTSNPRGLEKNPTMSPDDLSVDEESPLPSTVHKVALSRNKFAQLIVRKNTCPRYPMAPILEIWHGIGEVLSTAALQLPCVQIGEDSLSIEYKAILSTILTLSQLCPMLCKSILGKIFSQFRAFSADHCLAILDLTAVVMEKIDVTVLSSPIEGLTWTSLDTHLMHPSVPAGTTDMCLLDLIVCHIQNCILSLHLKVAKNALEFVQLTNPNMEILRNSVQCLKIIQDTLKYNAGLYEGEVSVESIPLLNRRKISSFPLDIPPRNDSIHFMPTSCSDRTRHSLATNSGHWNEHIKKASLILYDEYKRFLMRE